MTIKHDIESSTTAKAEIRQRQVELEREDRNLRHVALKAVSQHTRPLFSALWAECGQTGHEWKFANYNFDGSTVWDKCVWCGSRELARLHDGSEVAST